MVSAFYDTHSSIPRSPCPQMEPESSKFLFEEALGQLTCNGYRRPRRFSFVPPLKPDYW